MIDNLKKVVFGSGNGQLDKLFSVLFSSLLFLFSSLVLVIFYFVFGI